MIEHTLEMLGKYKGKVNGVELKKKTRRRKSNME